ncbi:hypothetical protein QEH56_21230 [Pelagicoccus enzymogenes]|uniref:MGH1-like glycoside hydrolase domain-containing protein n=1 Tax=Pelagicoccus enzymogenes TaxID=2773457 RepID=UPI00280C6D8B|nr:hypothetical protein [Pelagicoccus enzymogenes]MDQ8200704.1 hypothetical protein [Pelagicoccus enzymogenes]
MIGESEKQRLAEDATREKNWKRWGPYLSERQWGTVREDYSVDGQAWRHFPFEHAHLRAYRWGEDGIAGFCDREGRLCLAPAFWNGADPIIKERLFGLNGEQGNHGEDCKEHYYYLDSTPTHTYSKALYKYPQREFPYEQLRQENAKRGLKDPEFELNDTDAFDENRYFDIHIEYAKGGPNDLLMRLTITNRGPDTAPIAVLPKLWFRNTWIWGCEHEGCSLKPSIQFNKPNTLDLEREGLGPFHFAAGTASDGTEPVIGIAENETASKALYGVDNYTPYTKDSFHRWIIDRDENAVMQRKGKGTLAMARYELEIPAGQSVTVPVRLYAASETPDEIHGHSFDQTFATAQTQADQFWNDTLTPEVEEETRELQRNAYAGLLWTKQFYHYSVHDWLKGDSDVAHAPPARKQGRNRNWQHLFNKDILSMPDKWEYPWYAAWDTAFHMLPFAEVDPDFAKSQLLLFLREWYMHPNGQLPAYEWALDDVNPPTHAWACWEVYIQGRDRGEPDIDFLKRAFSKLLINFTWWVNRKDPQGRNLFGGGFLGLDNIGLFDRSKPLPGGAVLNQADGTAWMAFYCSKMLSIALELAHTDKTYSDLASKFFEHFMSICEAANHLTHGGLWDEQDGFYYDEIEYPDGSRTPLRVRSVVGLLPIIASLSLPQETLDELPGFRKRMDWYLNNRKDITRFVEALPSSSTGQTRLLALPNRERLTRLLSYLFDENEFLSPFGIRSLSRIHESHPYSTSINGDSFELRYCPGDSDTYLFGGNSNWRGPIWFPVNYLLIEALDRYHKAYGDSFQIEFPTGSGQYRTLEYCAQELRRRLTRLFKRNSDGRRPAQGPEPHKLDENEPPLFYEFFNPETGKGHGASHQTGWTALVATLVKEIHREKLQ